MSSVELAPLATAQPAVPKAASAVPPLSAASNAETFGKLMTGLHYATSPQGRQQITEAESNLFMSIILAGVAWIAFRALFPARKKSKK